MAVIMEGPLSKWTNVMKGWQYRWFVLDDNAGLLSYYTSKEKMIRGARRGCVRLQEAIIGIDDEDDSTFTITVDQKVFHFQARDSEERKEWVSALEDTILRHNQKKFITSYSSSSLSEFDRRLAEADAYLQLLIENVKGIEVKIDAMDSSASGKEDLEGVLSTAREMIEAVKKSIVLLQLAKTAVSANYVTSEEALVCQTLVVTEDSEEFNVEQREACASAPDLPRSSIDETSKLTPDLGVRPKKQSLSTSQQSLPVLAHRSSLKPDPVLPVSPDRRLSPEMQQIAQESPAKSLLESIPATSYSSSEDGDEFFDASEAAYQNTQNKDVAPPKEPKKLSREEEEETKNDDDNSKADAENVDETTENLLSVSEAVPVSETAKIVESMQKPIEKENDDDMFMQEESYQEVEGESLEEHKSIIMHLLSQVKLGMDLTKVVLPTFILEKRSLLEMYADFFSHADFFLDIAQKPTPEERMVACVRFYLSTFSAGRNSSVAKKPYNPIMGEFFQCFWKHKSFPSVTQPPVAVSDGPVPWAKSNQLAFIAEQVSHHPPVSAFYAEHKDQRIQFNGHIWTKSKFLGLSVGVHNIGQGCVRLLDLDEEYILTFPNGYGRSILTVPWFELGGDCTITCEKTGYNAIVKFHTKPFYGGKIHKVTGEIYKPNVKKPLCTLEGEWNTVMFCSYPNEKRTQFVDSKRSKKTKIVRKIEYQEPTESRRLWKEVTTNLKTNKIDLATEAKRVLEDQQRNDAKMRLENNIVYKPRFFHEDDCQNWIYNNTLTDRTPS